MLLDVHGIFIVIGGSVAATAVGFKINRVFMMAKVFWLRTIKGSDFKPRELILQMMKIAEGYRTGVTNIDTLLQNTKDDFLREAVLLLSEKLVEEQQLVSILEKRNETIYNRYREESSAFGAMGKYPPAMGLMGAVLGMITLLAGLGQPGAEKTVGPALSIALVATFYGIAMANLVIIPISENLSENARELKQKNKMIIHGVVMIGRKTNPVVLVEELNSFLLPSERIDLKTSKL
jgi:chemotaxis protein MotA